MSGEPGAPVRLLESTFELGRLVFREYVSRLRLRPQEETTDARNSGCDFYGAIFVTSYLSGLAKLKTFEMAGRSVSHPSHYNRPTGSRG
jgi:hypothetical protein